MGLLSDFFSGGSSEAVSDDFTNRLEKAKTAYREQFGKDLPITSRARTREEQQRLFDEFKAGKKGVYMPVNPADFPNRQTFHESAADISQSVPESFLNQFGIHRPLGKNDPVHAVAMPTQPQSLSSFFTPVEQAGVQAEDMSKPFVGFPSAKKPAPRPAQEADTLQRLGQGVVSLADQPINLVTGALDVAAYPLARAVYGWQMSPEEAAAKAKAETTSPKNILGRALGIEQTPGYQAEVTRAVPRAIGETDLAKYITEHISEGVDAISAKTGVPKADIESMIQSLGIAAGPALGKGLQATGRGLKTAAETIQEARGVQGQLQQQLAQKQAPGMVSGGAAATVPENVLRGNIQAAVAQASPELQNYVKTVNPNRVDLPALETRALEEKHGINLSTGQRTGDTSLYSQEWNKRGETSTLGEHFNEQPRQFKAAFENSMRKYSPEIFDTEPSALGQIEINALAAKDKLRTDAISQAYKRLEDANGGTFPIDIGALETNINQHLVKNLKSNHLSSAIASDLAEFYKNPTFESYEALRTNLANEMRSSSNGNARAAAYIVRDELEKMPVFGEGTSSPQAMQLKALADDARKLVRERATIIKNNPAYRAAIGEAADLKELASTGESLNAEKFHKKYVTAGTPESIRRMKAELADSPEASQAMIAGELRTAMRKAGLASDTPDLNPKTLANYIIDNKGRLQEALGPQAMQDLMEIAALSSKVGMPKTGTFNYSNTFSGMLGDLARQGLSNAAETKLAMATKGASIPAVSLGKQMLQKMNKEGFARQAVNPYGGLTKD
jgi:hypothetical protein